MYTHNYGLFIILAQNIFVLTMPLLTKELKLDFKKWLLLQCLLLVIYLPWLGILNKQILLVQEGFWISTPTLNSLIKTLTDYSAHSPLLLLLFVLLSYFSLLHVRKDESKNIFIPRNNLKHWIDMQNLGKLYLLSLWVFVPIIVPFLISKFSTSIYHTRYTISASLPFYILIAKGAYNIGNRYIRPAIISLIILLSLTGINAYYSEFKKPHWAEAVRYIDKTSKPSDLLLFYPGDSIDTGFNYYSKRTDLVKKPFPHETNGNYIEQLKKTLQGHKRIWFIMSYDTLRKKHILDIIKSLQYNLVYFKDYSSSGWQMLLNKTLEIYLFEKKD